MYVYIHTHSYTHTHTHIYIYIYIYTWSDDRIGEKLTVTKLLFFQIYIYIYKHIYIYIYIYIYIQTHTHIYTHTHTHTYTNTHTNIYIYIYIYSWSADRIDEKLTVTYIYICSNIEVFYQKYSKLHILLSYSFEYFSHQRLRTVIHRSLSDSKSPQASRSLLSILADLNNSVVWTVTTRPVISKSSRPCTNPLVTVPRALITIGISFSIVFQFPTKFEVLIPLLAFFRFYPIFQCCC